MRNEDTYNRDAVIQSYINQFNAIAGIINDTIGITPTSGSINNFVMTTYQGLTLGMNMHPENDNSQILVLGWSDPDLIKLCEGLDDYEIGDLREKLNDGETIKHSFTNIFFVPDMDYDYYEKCPLVSVDLKIPKDKVIDKSVVTGLLDAVEASVHFIESYFGTEDETSEDDS